MLVAAFIPPMQRLPAYRDPGSLSPLRLVFPRMTIFPSGPGVLPKPFGSYNPPQNRSTDLAPDSQVTSSSVRVCPLAMIALRT